MDVGIAEVRKSEKKTLGGPRATLRGPNSALGGPRATPKVYKLTPVALTKHQCSGVSSPYLCQCVMPKLCAWVRSFENADTAHFFTWLVHVSLINKISMRNCHTFVQVWVPMICCIGPVKNENV